MIFEKIFENWLRNKATNPFFGKLMMYFLQKKFEESPKTKDHYMMIVGAKYLTSFSSTVHYIKKFINHFKITFLNCLSAPML